MLKEYPGFQPVTYGIGTRRYSSFGAIVLIQGTRIFPGKLSVILNPLTKAAKLVLSLCVSRPSAAEITKLSKLRSLAIGSVWAALLLAAPALALSPVCRSETRSGRYRSPLQGSQPVSLTSLTVVLN